MSPLSWGTMKNFFLRPIISNVTYSGGKYEGNKWIWEPKFHVANLVIDWLRIPDKKTIDRKWFIPLSHLNNSHFVCKQPPEQGQNEFEENLLVF